MKFMISRTSTHGQESPCKEAHKESCIRVDTRSVNDPTKIPAHRGEDAAWWYSEGRNHRVEKGLIKRDFDDEVWFIEINTLEELLKLYTKYGHLVIQGRYNNAEIVEIEIYDDYRE